MTLAGEHYRNTTKRIRKVVLEYVMKCVLCNGAGEYKQLYVIGCGRDTLGICDRTAMSPWDTTRHVNGNSEPEIYKAAFCGP